jgi:hypothetical protein
MESCKDFKDLKVFKDFKVFNDLKDNKQLTVNHPGHIPGHEKTRRQ